MASGSIERQLALYMQRGIQVVLGIDPSQTSISIIKMRDANWLSWPHYQVVPGAVRPDGGGHGSQDGGAIIRRQEMSVHLFTNSKSDEHGMSDELLTNMAIGTLEQFEALRQLFAYTFFGNGSDFILSEPLFFERESQTVWEDEDRGLVSREFVWSAQYALNLPNEVTLSLNDVQFPQE